MTTEPPVDVTWHGALDTDAYSPAYLTEAHRLADAARAGRWDRVLAVLAAADHVGANTWRPGDTSGYTPLHQAAWHGAPTDVTRRIIAAGGWRTLASREGRRAVDIAAERGHTHLKDLLTPVPHTPVDADVLAAFDAQLSDLIDTRVREFRLTVRLRHPGCVVLTEIDTRQLWYPIPGMYGGFNIALREAHLYVTSWSRVAGGSGQAHLITRDGTQLVEDGLL